MPFWPLNLPIRNSICHSSPSICQPRTQYDNLVPQFANKELNMPFWPLNLPIKNSLCQGGPQFANKELCQSVSSICQFVPLICQSGDPQYAYQDPQYVFLETLNMPVYITLQNAGPVNDKWGNVSRLP